MGASPGGHGTHGTHSPGRLSLRPSHHTRLRCASPWVSSGSKQEARPGRAITYRSGTRPRPSSGERREGYRACPEELCVRQGQLPLKSRVGGRAAPPGHVPPTGSIHQGSCVPHSPPRQKPWSFFCSMAGAQRAEHSPSMHQAWAPSSASCDPGVVPHTVTPALGAETAESDA